MTERKIETLMGDAVRAARRIDLPVPAAGLGGLAAFTQLAELIALEVFRLAAISDLPHQSQDAGFLGARKKVGKGLPAIGSFSGSSQCSHTRLAYTGRGR
jgi:hypothetical protein